MPEHGARLVLVGSSDGYLLEEALEEQVHAAAELLGDAAVVDLGAGVTPERLADEVVSGSLFDPRRVLLVRDIGSWLQAPAPVGGSRDGRAPDPAPLVSSLEAGIPEDVVLVMGAWCGGKPRGPLVDLVRERGRFEWVPLPARPKPWEDAVISAGEAATLRRILQKNQPELRLSPKAEELLFARLGFAPRQLIAEAGKLAAAAGPGVTVDEELVRQLCFPRERSLDAVRNAILKRDPRPLADLIEALEGGIPVRDWQGKVVDASAAPFMIVGQVLGLVTDLLVLRRLLASRGDAQDLDRKQVGDRSWYNRRFKNDLGPWILERLDAETWGARRKRPSIWSLSNLVRGAVLYRDEELIAALATSGALEERLRSGVAVEALSAWLLALVA
ncbi:MAG: hypothetical protein GXP47_02845 [Acidobacteria bacterium]|nr:hypothetical protein [Acidobacteriota bacterium]